jgi:proteasome lid subunit RPN8/RPN11
MTTTLSTSAAPLSLTPRTWRRLMRQLARRGRGTRESGALLLAPSDEPLRVVALAFYDDLDPSSLWGGITFSREGFARLADLCRERRLVVVADVHTHPGGRVAQSPTDRTNPMVAIAGHVAIVVPNYARGRISPRDVGVHVYEGDHRWTSRYGADSATVLVLTGWRRR